MSAGNQCVMKGHDVAMLQIDRRVMRLGRRWALAFAECFVLFLAAAPGCHPVYEGKVISPGVERVALFDIEGPDGTEVTKVLAIALNASGRTVVYPGQIGNTPSDDQTAAKIARDLSAGAYIRGEITESKTNDRVTKRWDFLQGTLTSVPQSEYTIRGIFRLYRAIDGDQFGGIGNVTFSGTVDKDSGQTGDRIAADVRKKFCRHVAEELSKGLGPIVPVPQAPKAEARVEPHSPKP